MFVLHSNCRGRCDKFSNFSFRKLGYAAGQGQIQWMQAPQPPENCPPGLEYLTQVDQLLIKQQVELLEGTGHRKLIGMQL